MGPKPERRLLLLIGTPRLSGRQRRVAVRRALQKPRMLITLDGLGEYRHHTSVGGSDDGYEGRNGILLAAC